ncbi:MAG: PEGA domain-containing protein [Myxococcales bacterium]|nr:PEGA domain-containing protein [Myxococcales bacterium]
MLGSTFTRWNGVVAGSTRGQHGQGARGPSHGVTAILIALSLASSLGWTSSVRADVAAEARFHDAAARAHYRARRFESALRSFFALHRLAPHPAALFNIALCFERLEQPDQAFLFYVRYLESEDDDPSRRDFAERARRRIEPGLALAEVRSDPPGAEIFVDGRERGSFGTTPRLIALSAGEHRIELHLPHHEPRTVDISARTGERSIVEAALPRLLGELLLDGPNGALVEARDSAGALAYSGTLPCTARIPPGDYTLTVEASGYERWQSLVRVVPLEAAEILVAPARLPPPTGELTVTASSAGAVVEVDGEGAGFAPVVLADLPVGAHTIRLTHPGLRPYEGEVEIVADDPAWLTVTLESPPRIERSAATWVIGGIGVGSMAGGAVTGTLALRASRRWNEAADPSVRRTGRGLALATDGLMIAALVAFSVATILYFVTAKEERRASRGTVSRGSRQ